MKSNPVYAWSTEEYNARSKCLLEGPEKYMSVREDEKFEIPRNIREWGPQGGQLSMRGVQKVRAITRWFDGEHIETIAREGIDLMADLPWGARPQAEVNMWRPKDDEE